MNRTQIRELKRGLNGERGLLTAVILTAVEDALKTPEQEDYQIIGDARAYLLGRAGQYWAHLECLGIRGRVFPAAFYEEK